jgi:three-Cys-motif partner protein
MAKRECHNCRGNDGNCHVPAADDLAAQCVGPWSEMKHKYLEKYLDATRGVRKMFYPYGNTVFIDLFSGPGKCINRETREEIDGGCLKAVKATDYPFNEYHFVDINGDNIDSLKQRTEKYDGNFYYYQADANEIIEDIVAELAKDQKRYHVVYLDPFGPESLRFSTIKHISMLNRVDLFIHFPIGSIRRNLPQWIHQEKQTILDELLGTRIWRERIDDIVTKGNMLVLLEIYKEQLQNIGFPENGLRYQNYDDVTPFTVTAIKNGTNVNLYLLMVAAKHPLAQKMWDSIIKIDTKGQRSLF